MGCIKIERGWNFRTITHNKINNNKMNNNFKKVLDLIAEMKQSFSKKEASKFEQATLVDGVTVIEYESLEVGMPVFVVADGEMIPAPEGTHALSGDMEGVSIVVDAEGIITEIIDTREEVQSATDPGDEENETPEAEPVAQSMSAEDVENIINARLESFTKAVEGLAEMTKAIADSNTQLVNELSSLKSEFETFKAQPSVETRESERFSKVGNLTARQAFLLKSK
jgi:hypothetical protein